MSAMTPPAQTSQGARTLFAVLALVGAAVFLYGAVQPQPTRAWGIYLVNLLFWSSFAITGPAIAGMMQLTEARWSPTVKRMALSTAGFLPVSLLLFLVLLAFGLGTLYPWVNNPALAVKKKEWLNVPFLLTRTVLGVVFLYWSAWALLKAVFAETPQDGPDAVARRNRISTILLMLYVVVLSLWGFDLLMSLDPRWYSGLFGGYYVVTSLYPGFGLVTFLVIRGNARGLTSASPSAVQDITKLTFATCVMWMYFFFSQYLVIWYGNVPAETRFFLGRFFIDPWRTMAFVILLVGAVVPFSYLLNRLTKRPPTGHKPLVVILFMGWVAIFLERLVVVFPSISGDNVVPLGLSEILITAGFFAVFMLMRDRFLGRYGALIRQPR